MWTIGYGITNSVKSITGATIYKGLTITQAQADEWLRLVINKRFGPNVDKFDYIYHWSQNEFDALCSFAYNIGSINELVSNGNLAKSQIPSVMKLYVKAKGKVVKGLVNRRNAEVELFNKGGYPLLQHLHQHQPQHLLEIENGFHRLQDLIKMIQIMDMRVFLEELLLV